MYTQPDRPAGRGRRLTPSPVKQAALDAGIPVRQPQTLKDRETLAQLESDAPDLMVVVAYGLILPKAALRIPAHGCWNVHASLLPRWRGAAPIHRALLAGDSETGVALMRMQAGLDTGPVLLERRAAIGPDGTAATLHDRLAVLGAEMLGDGLKRLARGESLIETPQSETGITYAHKLEKSEARLDWRESAAMLARKVRAFTPWPVAEALIDGELVRIHAAQAIDAAFDEASSTNHPPGCVVGDSREFLDVATGDGVLRILELQRAGGRRVSARDWLNARRDRTS